MAEVRVKGSDELAAKLERILTRIEDPSGAATTLGEVFGERLRRRFEAEGEGDWPEHRRGTDRLRPGGRKMRDTGALLDAVTSGRVQRADGGIRYTADMPFYGALLSERATLPPFPIVREGDPELAAELVDELRKFLLEGTA